MKTLLIGCGAVGLGIASALYDSGVSVDLLARGRTKESIEQNGILREGIFKKVEITPEKVRVYERLEEITSLHYDIVLICSKTTGNTEIAAQLKQHRKDLLSPEGFMVLCQNGFGNEDAFFECIDQSRIYSASFAIGFERPEPFFSRVTVFSSPIKIGSLFGASLVRVEPLAEAIREGGIPCQTETGIEKTLWAKMLYNCTLNPLSAILKVNYGGLTRSRETVEIMNHIIEEIYAVMHAADYTTFWPDAQTYQKEFFAKILPPTYGHRSSTLQDMERGIKTEIESLNGVVVQLGEKYGVNVPVNKMIYRLIKSMEGLYDYRG